jgi:hypothetical protein
MSHAVATIRCLRGGDAVLNERTYQSGASRAQARRRRRLRWARVGAALAVAAAIGVIVWVAFGGSSKPSEPTGGAQAIPPVALSVSGLRTLAGAVGQPIYWAGPLKGYRYELTRTNKGYVYIRYLPHGVKAGAAGSKYLVIGTYPYPHAYAALKSLAGGAQFAAAGGKGIAVVEPKATNVRVAFPGVDYQIEVYDPFPKVARDVAKSHTLQPVS